MRRPYQMFKMICFRIAYIFPVFPKYSLGLIFCVLYWIPYGSLMLLPWRRPCQMFQNGLFFISCIYFQFTQNILRTSFLSVSSASRQPRQEPKLKDSNSFRQNIAERCLIRNWDGFHHALIPLLPQGTFIKFFVLTFKGNQIVWDDTRLMEETFGPVHLLMKAESLDDAIQIVNRNKYGNGASIFTTSRVSTRKFQRDIEAGQVGISTRQFQFPCHSSPSRAAKLHSQDILISTARLACSCSPRSRRLHSSGRSRRRSRSPSPYAHLAEVRCQGPSQI